MVGMPVAQEAEAELEPDVDRRRNGVSRLSDRSHSAVAGEVSALVDGSSGLLHALPRITA